MSGISKTYPAQDYEKLTSFASDINNLSCRAVEPVGGTQFVFVTASGQARTVPAVDFSVFSKRPVEVISILSATDCTAVHCWS